MFNPYMNSLLQNASVHHLIHTNTYRALGNIKHDSGPSVVVLVWHTLVDGGISEDVDVVAHFNGAEVTREIDGSVFAKFLGEHVSRTSAGSE